MDSINNYHNNQNNNSIDKKIINLINNISEPAFYQQIKIKLKIISENIINESYNIDNNNIENIKEIIKKVMPPESLLRTHYDIKFEFLNNPDENNEIFEPLKLRIENFKEYKELFQISKDSINYYNNKIIELLNCLIENYQNYIIKLVEKSKNENIMSFNILECKPLLLLCDDDLLYRDISLEKAYEISSYNQKEFEYSIKKNYNGQIVIGNKVNGIYFKVLDQNFKPAKENAVYQFYTTLYNNEDQKHLISETQLLVLSQLPILPPDLDQAERKDLSILKQKYGKKFAREIFNIEPELERRIERVLKKNRELFLQSSIIEDDNNNGQLLLEFLRKSKDNPNLYDFLDRESFSSHIISNILLNTSNKPDSINILKVELDDGKFVYKLIGIENDQCLEGGDIEKKNNSWYCSFKNILFTLPLMKEPINQKIRSQIIDQHPNLFLLNWLVKIIEKESIYHKFIETSIQSDLENNIEEIKIKLIQQLNLQIKFSKDWIKTLLNRFSRIKDILLVNGTISHEELFEKINPLSNFFYHQLSKKYKDNPLEFYDVINQLKYDFKILISNKSKDNLVNYNFDQYQSPSFETTESISDVLKELLLISDYKKFLPNNLINWLELIIKIKDQFSNIFIDNLEENQNYSNKNQYNDDIINLNQKDGANYFNKIKNKNTTTIKLHESWYGENSKLILTLLIKQGASDILIKEYIEIVGLTFKEINEINEGGSIIHIAINSNTPNLFIQLKMLKSLNVDLENIQGSWTTPLGISAYNKHYGLFKLLIDLGAGSNTKYEAIKSVLENQNTLPLDIYQYLFKLIFVNPKLSLKLTLDEVFENITNNNMKGNILLKLVSESDRIITLENWNKIFNQFGQKTSMANIQSKLYTSNQSSTVYLENKSLKIMIKFDCTYPGKELSVIDLCTRFFKFCSPYCQIGSIKDTPVLLYQGIKSQTLQELIEKPNYNQILNKLDSYNLSKIIVMSMIINPSNNNLNDFLISPIQYNNNSQEDINFIKYILIPINNENSLLPSVTKDSQKLTLQVETILFLLNQMNEPIHKDVIKEIKECKIESILKQWLEYMKQIHQEFIEHFRSINFNINQCHQDKKTIIGVSFYQGCIKQIYTKLIRLQTELNKEKILTHFELLEIIEPLVAICYKPLLFNQQLTLKDKFLQLKLINQQINHPLNEYLSSREYPNLKSIQKDLWSMKFTPNESLFELLQIIEQKEKVKEILSDLNNKKNNNNNNQISNQQYELSEGIIEMLIEEINFKKLTIQQEQFLFDSIKGKALRYLFLQNSQLIKLSILKTFNLKTVIRMDLSNSNIENIKNINKLLKGSYISMPALTHLKLKNCKHLSTIKICANNLKVLNCSNCPQLKYRIEAQNLEEIKLSNSSIDQKTILKISKCKQLIKLNISKSIILPQIKELNFSFESLISFISNDLTTIEKIYLNLPKVEYINLEGCLKLSSINGIAPLLKTLEINTDFILNKPQNNQIYNLQYNNNNNYISSKINICGINKHLPYFRKLIGSNLPITSNCTDYIKNQNFEFQFWYLLEKENNSTTIDLYLRNCFWLILFFDLSLGTIQESIEIFKNYCKYIKNNQLNIKIILFGFGYGLENGNENEFKLKQFKEEFNIEIIIYLPYISEQYQRDYIKDSLFSTLRNDKIQFLINQHIFQSKKEIELFKVQKISTHLLNNNVLIIQMLELLDGVDLLDLIEYFKDEIIKIKANIELLNQLNNIEILIKQLIEKNKLNSRNNSSNSIKIHSRNGSTNSNHSNSSSNLLLYVENIINNQKDQTNNLNNQNNSNNLSLKYYEEEKIELKNKLNNNKELIGVVFRNLKRIYYIALIKDIKKVIDLLKPIYSKKFETFQKDYFKDYEENIDFSFSEIKELYQTTSSGFSSNSILPRICYSKYLLPFQLFIKLKDSKLLNCPFDDCFITSHNLNDDNNLLKLNESSLNSSTSTQYLLNNIDEEELNWKNQMTPLSILIDQKCTEILLWLIKNEILQESELIDEALLRSSMNGNLEYVKLFLSNGADVNYYPLNLQMSPLLFASKYGHLDVVRYLFDNGADIHCRNKDGLTSLHYATQSNSSELLDLLLSKDNSGFFTTKSQNHIIYKKTPSFIVISSLNKDLSKEI